MQIWVCFSSFSFFLLLVFALRGNVIKAKRVVHTRIPFHGSILNLEIHTLQRMNYIRPNKKQEKKEQKWCLMAVIHLTLGAAHLAAEKDSAMCYSDA